MTNLAEEHPTATHFMFIAASGEGGHDGNKSVFAWWLMTPNQKGLWSGNSALTSSVGDWSNAAMLEAVLEAVTQGHIPTGAYLHVISDQKFFTDLLKKGRATRRAEGYLKTSGEPLAYAEKWRELHVEFDKLNLTETAAPPVSYPVKRILTALKGWARTLKDNIDNHGDWTSSLGPSVEIGGRSLEPKGSPASAVPDFPADWQWTISNDIPPPVKPRPKKRQTTRRP